MGRLKLAQILKHKVCVHHYAQFRPCKEEAGDEAPYLGWELEDLVVVEVEPLDGDHAKVTADRRRENSSCKGPACVVVRASRRQARGGGACGGPYRARGGARQ